MSILGVDIGNFNTNTSNGVIFQSKASKVSNLLGSKYSCSLFNEEYKLGEGDFDNEFRKVNKDNYLELLFGALALSNCDRNVDLVLGLPISQYRADRDILINKINEHYHLKGTLNSEQYEFYITDVEVYPEGIASVDKYYNGIVVDIGGRTTDCCLIGNHKVQHPLSIPKGTLNLYNDFINAINNKYSLDLTTNDVDRLLRQGLKIEGERVDIKFAKDIFKDFVKNLVSQLKVEYSLKTFDVTFTGGGSLLLEGIITNILPYAEILENSLFANAYGFKRIGEEMWG